MVHLSISIIAALAIAISTWDATGSLALSLLAYVLTGSLVLTMSLISDWLDIRSEDRDSD